MRLPLAAPDTAQLLARLKPDDMAHLARHISPTIDDQYLHWDQLRHRPPPAGLSTEQWWLAIALARTPLLQNLPLFDQAGRPFQFAVPNPVQIDLHHIDRDAAGHIRAQTDNPLEADRQRYLLNSLIEEAITSSQLEGASTTRKVAADMLRQGRKPRDVSERMIFNNYRAMEHIRSLKQQALTPGLILQLQQMLTEGTLDDPADEGRWRSSDDVRVVDNRDGTILHQPPAAADIPQRMQQLCEFANADEAARPFVHPVLRAMLLHFMIGYEHPFADGNGRTARALFYWSMARSGYWLMEFVSISHILRQAPAQYVKAYLHSETNNDTTFFLLHQLSTVRKAIVALHDYLARKTRDQRDTERLLHNARLRGQLNHRQLALLTHALKNPGQGYRVDAHQRSHAIVYQTARSDLLSLEALGLLEKVKQGQAFVFYAVDGLEQRINTLPND